MPSCLITGITGSGGSYLAEYILDNHPDWKVYGTSRWHSTTTMDNILDIREKIKIYECDLLDFSSILNILLDCKPDRVYHLASHANVHACFKIPLAVIYNNVMSTANLFEACKMIIPNSTIMLCSTSEVYGNPKTVPMLETHPHLPVNPYSASKLSQEAMAHAWHQSWNMDIKITRAFAYLNPRRHDLFASSFARQVVKIEKGEQDVLFHGNLESIRTLMDVRDMASAYWIACEKCLPAEPYNIGGVDIMTVGDFLEKLIRHSKIKIRCIQDPYLLRPKDVTNQVCDTTKFRTATGWLPRYTFDESIEFLLNHYRKEMK